ncbi:hypothetical protein Tco_0278102 [Tanacetum coccineum]
MSNTNNTMPTQTSSVLHNDTDSSSSTFKVQEKTQLSRSRCMNSLREVKSQFKFLSETLQDFEFKERMQKFTRFNAQSFQDAMIYNMDSIGKYMLEIILLQQRTPTMLLNVDQLQKQLDKDDFQKDGSMAAFWVINRKFQQFIDSQFTLDYDSQMTNKYFAKYTGIEMQTQESKVDTGKALDVDLVVIEISRTKSEVQDERNRLGNDIDTDDADIRPTYDEEPMVRSKPIKQTTSLLAKNADLKAQIQEKVFAIAALKNDLRKLKGNRLKCKKQRFASQVDVNKNLSKPVTQHYLPKKTESAFAKLDHMIASSSSRNSSKNMPRFSSNDMVHNHYLDVAKKKTQERGRNSKISVMPTARFQSTADDSKPKPRNNN